MGDQEHLSLKVFVFGEVGNSEFLAADSTALWDPFKLASTDISPGTLILCLFDLPRQSHMCADHCPRSYSALFLSF